MVDPISNRSTALPQSYDVGEPVEEKQNKGKSGIWWLFRDVIAPWRNQSDPASVKPTNAVDNDPIQEQDKANCYKALNEFMHEAQEASKESGLSLKDVFNELDRIQMQDQRDIMKESEMETRKDLLESHQERRKISDERMQKMQEALERAKNTKFWEGFKKTATFLQAALTTLGTGAVSLSNPVGIASAVLMVGEAVDSMFEDVGKKFLLEMTSKLLPSEDRAQFQDKGLQALNLGVGLVSAVLGRQAFSSGTLTDLGKQVKTFATTANITTKGMAAYSEIKSDRSTAQLMNIEESERLIKEQIKDNVQTLEQFLKQEMGTWENQRTIQEGRHQTNLSFSRF